MTKQKHKWREAKIITKIFRGAGRGFPSLAMRMPLVFLCLALPLTVWAYTDSQIADAIYKAEGGKKTKYPYGIRSVSCNGEDGCRKVCLNSIHNAKKRWEKAGKPEDFIVFMGRRYCPPKAHSLNSNWVKNVRYFLEKNKKEEVVFKKGAK